MKMAKNSIPVGPVLVPLAMRILLAAAEMSKME